MKYSSMVEKSDDSIEVFQAMLYGEKLRKIVGNRGKPWKAVEIVESVENCDKIARKCGKLWRNITVFLLFHITVNTQRVIGYGVINGVGGDHLASDDRVRMISFN